MAAGATAKQRSRSRRRRRRRSRSGTSDLLFEVLDGLKVGNARTRWRVFDGLALEVLWDGLGSDGLGFLVLQEDSLVVWLENGPLGERGRWRAELWWEASEVVEEDPVCCFVSECAQMMEIARMTYSGLQE